MYLGSPSGILSQMETPLSQNGEFEISIELINNTPFKLTVSLKDTVEQLKDKIRKVQNLSEDEYISLLLDGETLEDDRTLESYKIDNKTTLHQSLEITEETTTNKNDFFVGIQFNDLKTKQEVEFAKSAPDFRRIKTGLNLRGICITKECKAENQTIWIQKGIGTFNICEEIYESKCPQCNKTAGKIDNLGFYNCLYSVKGLQTEPELIRVEQNDIVANDKRFTTFFSTGALARWATLVITTKLKNDVVVNVNPSMPTETTPKNTTKCSIQ